MFTEIARARFQDFGWVTYVNFATMPRCLAPLLRYQAVWSPPIFTACVCDQCRVRVLVRLSHPRPPDRSQHGCTVGVLPGPTRVLPMPRQCGIGRRATTRAVLSCAALWCLVVRSSTFSCGLFRPHVYWIPSHRSHWIHHESPNFDCSCLSCKASRGATGVSNFLRAFLMVSLNSLSSRSMK